MFAKIVTITFLLIICGCLIFSFSKWIKDYYLYKNIIETPEKYNIEPGVIIKMHYEYGYPGTYEVYIKDVNKKTGTVLFTSTKYENFKTEVLSAPIETFYRLYIKGHAINSNRYTWPDDLD